MPDGLSAELTDMEHRFWDSATDPDFYREHLADEAVLVFHYGVGAMDKQMVIYAIKATAEAWISHEFEAVRVVPIGDDAAVITYKASGERAGDAPFRAFVSSAYVRRNGRWSSTSRRWRRPAISRPSRRTGRPVKAWIVPARVSAGQGL